MIQKIAELKGHNAAVYALAEADSPRYIFSASGEGWLVRWDLDAPDLGKLIARVEGNIFSICYLAEQQLMLLGDMHGGMHWVELNAPDQQRNIAHHRNGVFAIKQVGGNILSAGGKGMLTKWSIAQKRPLESLQLSHESLRTIAYSPARNELAIGASDHAIYFLDATTLAQRSSIPMAHDNSVFTVQYHPDGQHLLSGGRDAQLKVWDLKTHTCVQQESAHWYTINSIAFHPEGHLFATASRDKTIKIWDAKTFQLLKVLETIRDDGHINSVNALLWTGHRNLLVSGSDDRSLKVWELQE